MHFSPTNGYIEIKRITAGKAEDEPIVLVPEKPKGNDHKDEYIVVQYQQGNIDFPLFVNADKLVCMAVLEHMIQKFTFNEVEREFIHKNHVVGFLQ